jgi:hypothetical protein
VIQDTELSFWLDWLCTTGRSRMQAMRKLLAVPICRRAIHFRLSEIALDFFSKSEALSPPSRLTQRGASRSSRTLSAGCGGRDGVAALVRRRTTPARTQNRVVLTPRRWCQVGEMISLTMGARQPGPQGEHDISVKAIVQGMPDDPAEPVVPAASFSYCWRAMGEVFTRHSLRPLRSMRAEMMHDSGVARRETTASCPRSLFDIVSASACSPSA